MREKESANLFIYWALPMKRVYETPLPGAWIPWIAVILLE
jgi:hypothetical protein